MEYNRLNNDPLQIRDMNMGDITRDMKKLTKSEFIEIRDQYLAMDSTSNIDLIAGVPSSWREMFFHSKPKQTYDRHCLYQLLYEQELKGLNDRDLMTRFIEILSKGLVYRELEPGTVIFVNSQARFGYVVRRLYVSGRGFTAVLMEALNPKDCDENYMRFILCTSGTELHFSGLDAASYYKTDLQKDIGEEAFASARPFLDDLVDDLSKMKEKVLLCGHSIGGLISMKIAATYPHMVYELVTFNAPGLPKRYHDMLEREEIFAPLFPIRDYQAVGDFVCYSGGLHLGAHRGKFTVKKLEVYIHTIHSLFYLKPHTYMCLSNPKNYNITYVLHRDPKIFIELHSKALEALRVLTSYLTTPFFHCWRGFIRTLVPSRVTTEYSNRMILDPWDTQC